MANTLITDDNTPDLIKALEELLKAAKDGVITGISAVVYTTPLPRPKEH